jgi:nitrous oxidase accessory protein NosD
VSIYEKRKTKPGFIFGAVLSACAAAATGTQTPALPTVDLQAGMVIDRSARVRPGTYRLPSAGLDSPALRVRGDGITLDLTGVTIEGAAPFADPDTFGGTGIAIEDAAGVTLRGGAIRGYKIAILARRAPRLHLTALDLSYNWKPRLKSGYEQEDQSDWLSFHQNDKDEWLRYGAAIYLDRTDDAEIDHVRAVQGMNGLLASRSARLAIWNNTFSYLSGLGVGLYRVTDSRIMHNRLDWCVRGYSHGFYYRGQDSAALLMYEQTSHNTVAYNSMTHGGDGVFLWAGQSTMDTGQGGANDNVFYGNDVSHAVANGIEATFSRNTFARNRIDDSWHGIWGGYSFDSLIVDNTFTGNDEAIAIEHGQNIRLVRNQFTGGNIGVRLWASPTQDPNWGYPKFRDTRSTSFRFLNNVFDGVRVGTDISRTTQVSFNGDRMTNVARPHVWGEGVPGLIIGDGPNPAMPLQHVVPAPKPFAGASDAMLPRGARRGRSTIIVDEWGPYDYLSPKLWPSGSLGARPITLRVLGPAGTLRLINARGARLHASAAPCRAS